MPAAVAVVEGSSLLAGGQGLVPDAAAAVIDTIIFAAQEAAVAVAQKLLLTCSPFGPIC